MLETMMSSRRFPTRSPWQRIAMTLAVGVAGMGTYAGVTSDASAAVPGRRGLEIEGARDRRGFFFSTGADFGATFFDGTPDSDSVKGLARINLVFGGGVTERFTLGFNLHVDPYFAPIAPNFGADIEGTGYLWEGLYLRAGVGGMGVPKIDDEGDYDGLGGGLGGRLGVGYEFWLNASAAMSVELSYDVRYVPGDGYPRQTPLIGFRFAWF